MLGALLRPARRSVAVPTALAIALGAAVLAGARPLRAELLCPAPAGTAPALAGIDGRFRLDWIDGRLAHTAKRARQYTWGWGIGIVAATGANLIPLAFVAPENRIDWYTGAGTTIIGIVPLLIAPLDVVGDSRTLRARVAGAAGDERQVCPLLADAEAILVRDAKNQADGQRWWLHVGNVVLNFGVGLFLGIGYHHWGAGALNAISGSLIGEAIILTQPTGSIADLDAYRNARLGGQGPASTGIALRFPL
jgi:hypothetical protein